MKRILDFVSYWFTAKTRHGTHSPFIYSLVEKCIYATNPRVSKEIENHFKNLKKSGRLLSGKDFGRGGNTSQFTVGHYAKSSSMLDFQAELLHRLVAYLKPKTILELGTNIGKSAAYMASADSTVNLITVDGNEALRDFADEQFSKLELNNIRSVASPFELFLESNEAYFDLVFVDGNHHYEPTVQYFNALKSQINKGGAIVFHDIYWSEGMKRAWSEIKRDQSIVVSLDLFFFGIVWFGKNQAKEDFKIRFPRNLFRLFFSAFF